MLDRLEARGLAHERALKYTSVTVAILVRTIATATAIARSPVLLMTSLVNRLRRRHSPPTEKPFCDELRVDDGHVQHVHILMGDVQALAKAPSS